MAGWEPAGAASWLEVREIFGFYLLSILICMKMDKFTIEYVEPYVSPTDSTVNLQKRRARDGYITLLWK